MATNTTDNTYEFDEYTSADWAYIGVGLGVIVAYFIVYALVFIFRPLRVSLGINIKQRRRWVKKVFPGNNQLLVVQTLRNGILTSTYFATSSSTIALFVTTEGINRVGVQQIQLLVLAGVMIAAFINFLLHIRGLNAMSYMAWGVPPPEANEEDNLDPEIGGKVSKRVITTAKTTMLRATVHYSIGVKVFILVLIVAGWMINPLGFLIGALVCGLIYVWMDFL